MLLIKLINSPYKDHDLERGMRQSASVNIPARLGKEMTWSNMSTV